MNMRVILCEKNLRVHVQNILSSVDDAMHAVPGGIMNINILHYFARWLQFHSKPSQAHTQQQ